MKQLICVVVLLAGNYLPAYAQRPVNDVSGTWQIEGVGRRPWVAILKVAGTKVTGTVSSCGLGVMLPAAISDGSVQGSTVRFTCDHGMDGKDTFAFTGVIDGDEMTLTCEHRTIGSRSVPLRGPDPTGLFGTSRPSRFVAKRVRTGGSEFAGAVNLLDKGLKVEGALFLPRNIERVRSVVVLINSGTSWNGLAASLYRDAEMAAFASATAAGLLLLRVSAIDIGGYMYFVTNPNAGADVGLLRLLDRLASDSAHPEVADAPLVFWGHSASGPFGSTFALSHPQRTIAFVRYHSGDGGLAGADLKSLGTVPALFLQEGRGSDAPTSAEPARTVWTQGRRIGAPWTFGIEPDATHQDPADVKKAYPLLIPWLTAVLKSRLPAAGGPLRPVVAKASTENWLPDEASAEGWRVVTGAVR